MCSLLTKILQLSIRLYIWIITAYFVHKKQCYLVIYFFKWYLENEYTNIVNIIILLLLCLLNILQRTHYTTQNNLWMCQVYKCQKPYIIRHVLSEKWVIFLQIILSRPKVSNITSIWHSNSRYLYLVAFDNIIPIIY